MADRQSESMRSFFILSPHSTVFVCDELKGLKPFYQIGWDNRLDKRFYPFLEAIILFPENRPGSADVSRLKQYGFEGDIVQCGKTLLTDPESIISLSTWNAKHQRQLHFDFSPTGWRLSMGGATVLDDQKVQQWSARSVVTEWKKVSACSDSFYPMKVWRNRGLFNLFGYRFYFHDKKLFLLSGGDSWQDVLYFLKSDHLQVVDYRPGAGRGKELPEGPAISGVPGGLTFSRKDGGVPVHTSETVVASGKGITFLTSLPGVAAIDGYPGSICPVREGIPYILQESPLKGVDPLQKFVLAPLQTLKKLFLPASRKLIKDLQKEIAEYDKIGEDEGLARKNAAAFNATLSRLFRVERKNPWSPLEFISRNLQTVLDMSDGLGSRVSAGVKWFRFFGDWEKRFRNGSPLLPLIAEIYPAAEGFFVLYNLEDTDFSHEDLKKINYYFGRLDTRRGFHGKFFDDQASLLDTALGLFSGSVPLGRRDRVMKMVNGKSTTNGPETTLPGMRTPAVTLASGANETDEEKKRRKNQEDEGIVIGIGKKGGKPSRSGFPFWIPLLILLILLLLAGGIFLFLRNTGRLNGFIPGGGSTLVDNGSDSQNGADTVDGNSGSDAAGVDNTVGGDGDSGTAVGDGDSSLSDDPVLAEMKDQEMIDTDDNGQVVPGSRFHTEWGEGAESRVHFTVDGFPVTIWDIYLVTNRIAIKNGYKDLTRKNPPDGDEPSLIYKGMVFDLPDGRKYKVEKADSIWRIAEVYIRTKIKEDSVTWKEILQRIKDPGIDRQEKNQWLEKARKLGESSPCSAFRKMVEEETEN